MRLTKPGNMCPDIPCHYLRRYPAGLRPMRTSRARLIHTRRSVIRLTSEHYLRDDIDTRLPGASERPFTSPGAARVLILDSETVLNQMDALQSEFMGDVLFLQTVYDSVKLKSRSTQNRVDRLLRTPEKHMALFANDHCAATWVAPGSAMTSQAHKDALIARALEYLGALFPVVFLVNDAADLARFAGARADVRTIHAFAEGAPGLAELLRVPGAGDGARMYEEHVGALRAQELVRTGHALTGVFAVSAFSRDEATVRTARGDVIVRTRADQNRAIDRDTVVVLLLDEPGPAPVGRVVAILKSATRVVCGVLQPPETVLEGWQNVLVVPMDPALPKIRIRTRQTAELLSCRIQVTIDGWGPNSRYPSGHYVATVGTSGDVRTESEAILLTHQIPHNNFSDAVLECLPPEDYAPTPEQVARRRDLRDRPVVSIDPPGCTDIDDALHYRALSDTECEVGVHIADVSFFVREGTAIDLEARERGTSVYLTEKRINMLPPLLSENLCSLRGGVERFAFSVIATLDAATAETKEIWFGRSIVTNRLAMSYQRAQGMVDDPSDRSEIADGVRQLLRLSRIMRQKRFDAGALTLSSPQLHFVLDSETKEPLHGELYKHREVNALVEEFMLYANIEVAKKIFQHFPQSAVLRRHESPLATRFESVNRALKRFSVQLDPESNRTLSETLDAVKARNGTLDGMVRMMATRCMQTAKYFAAGTQNYDSFSHYGLAMPIYTHFTSPIRRYADLLAHRQLAVAVGEEPPSDLLVSKPAVCAIADNLNFRHRMAQEAGRDSAQLFMMEMLRKTPNRIEDGRVFRVKPTVFVVLLDKFGVEGHVHVDGEQWSFSEDEEALQCGSRTIRVFDSVRVRVNVRPMNMHGRIRLDLELVTE